MNALPPDHLAQTQLVPWRPICPLQFQRETHRQPLPRHYRPRPYRQSPLLSSHQMSRTSPAPLHRHPSHHGAPMVHHPQDRRTDLPDARNPSAKVSSGGLTSDDLSQKHFCCPGSYQPMFHVKHRSAYLAHYPQHLTQHPGGCRRMFHVKHPLKRWRKWSSQLLLL